MAHGEEYLQKETKQYELYYFKDDERQINQKSSMIFKDEDKFICYPFGYNGGSQYSNIESIELIGFNKEPKKFPQGIVKSVHYGWGFTKPLKPIGNYLNNELEIKKIIIEKKGKIELDTNSKILYINETCLKTLNTNMTKVLYQTKKDIRNAALIELNSFYPEIQRPIEKYNKDDLSKVLKKWNNDIDEFSDDDKNEILNLFNKLTLSTNFITNEGLLNTKSVIDKKYIENTIIKYKELQQQTSDTTTLEKKWQKFLEDNNWIFGTIFAQPIILFQREAYVGGKSIDNSNGKFTDFLLKNKLTNNVSFFEIKTHLTKLVDDKPYRGSDVFTTSKELNSCISQVLNQRDNFQKEFCIHQYKSKNNIESFNSQCIVLIGSLSKLNDEQKKSFELFRNNSSSVEILTFDEVLTKLETFLSLLG